MTLNMVHHRLSCPGASIFSWKNLSKAAHDGAHEGVSQRVSKAYSRCVTDQEPGDCLALPVPALIHTGDKVGQSLSCGRLWALPGDTGDSESRSSDSYSRTQFRKTAFTLKVK